MDSWLVALMFTAATVGALHSLAPDHWVPFAALARVRGWTPLRTARLAFFCGLGHVSVSALLGIGTLFVGLEAAKALGSTLGGNASLLLMGFGLAYMVWGLWRNLRGRMLHEADHIEEVPHDHGHGHQHRHRHHEKRGVTEWGLFFLFCADPCVALIPMILAASAGGWGAVAALIAVYEIATIGAMIVLVQTAHAGARAIRLPLLERWGDAIAGGLIVVLGALVTVLGI